MWYTLKKGAKTMNVYEAIKLRRTIRKFKQTPIGCEDIIKIIDAGRLAPTGANLQPLKFRIVTDETLRKDMFPHIKYAGYLPDWNPEFEETPTAFIAILNDTAIKPTEKTECDSGAVIMNMCLMATELNIGSCWLGAINRAEIKKTLKLDDKYDITYLLGLGFPAQSGEAVKMNDSIRYYHDENQNVCVPKRSIDDVIV